MSVAKRKRCIVHRIRNSLKYVFWKDRKAVAKDLKAIYTAPTEEDGQIALSEFDNLFTYYVFISHEVPF